MSFAPIKDGEFTSTIYGMPQPAIHSFQIKDGKYNEVIRILQYEVQRAPTNRAALSLLGYCYYYCQDFINAVDAYSQLAQLFPNFPEYKVYHAQSLYNAFMLPEALQVVSTIEEEHLLGDVVKLESAIKYREEDMNNARILVEQYPPDDPDTEMNLACLDYKEGDYTKALERFNNATSVMGYQPELAYAIALCHYRKKEYQQALKFINDIEALTDMPPRAEEELDAVTLHNQALIGIDTNPADGFAKLQFLLSQNPFPPETFANLLLLYCKYEYQYDYLDALISLQTSPDEAYAKFDAMANEQMNELRSLTKRVQEIRQGNDENTARKAVEAFDETLELYLPVLMSQAKIYWDKGDYARVERIFRKSVEFCSEHDTWKLNVAHTLFMQEQKFKEAAGFYEPIVSKNFVNSTFTPIFQLLDVSAIILANLCVCYIMTNQNEEAEELMRKVEREEDDAREVDETRKCFHVCIINLGNFEFGISRVIKAMEPQERKLGTDTWYYAKRCLLATIGELNSPSMKVHGKMKHRKTRK
ncbi:unnamed protein product [Nippostrongylus brasiliensis]|uniref:Tetratricopeptide repeat protein 30 n=1 Tax=Nippostrongylus brasiliensis TaxID=27835 RepID=A0A0N4Y2C7_NIPBR|nr:unnamed protein product [Nippostrongylus brasiliensis]